MLKFRSLCISSTRSFFDNRGYLETDTPALSPTLIPETCLEVFKTEYIIPWKTGLETTKTLFLVPSPELYLKQIIAEHGVSVYQISKCYRNVESIGYIHSPEFTMLEYYTMHADYIQSLEITEHFIVHLLHHLRPYVSEEHCEWFTPPFIRMTMDEAFLAYAGFYLSDCPECPELAKEAARLGLGNETELAQWPWADLYGLIFVHAVEPNLPREKPVFLMDYPERVPCLAKERQAQGNKAYWKTKERWELYANGVELANCYSEERDIEKITAYFDAENAEKTRSSLITHPQIPYFPEICDRMPPCSGVAIGLDRLIMVLSKKTTIDPVLTFPLRFV